MPLWALLLACRDDGLDSPDGRDSGDSADGVEFPDGHALVSDLRGNRWYVTDPDDGATIEELHLDSLEPTVCTGEENDLYCLLFQSRVHTGFDGREEVQFTYAAMDLSDGDDDGRSDLVSRVWAVDRETHDVRWHIDALDFSGSGSDACPYDPDDPCDAASQADDETFHDCSLFMTHDMAVTDEDADAVAMWLVDSRNSRMLHVTVPRTSSCAAVDTVFDLDHPEWDIYNSVNSVLFDRAEDGTEELLMSVKGSFSGGEAAIAQFGGPGKGKIVLWRRRPADDWHQVWEFPPQSTTEESFLNDPHGATWATGPDGTRWVMYAHSLGRSDTFSEGTGGSVGVLSVPGDAPTYLFDGVVDGDLPLHFPRDVTPLPDGSFLVSDSGCIGDDCPYPTLGWRVRVDDATASGRDGVWTPDHERQAFRALTVLDGPVLQDAEMIYSASWIDE